MGFPIIEEVGFQLSEKDFLIRLLVSLGIGLLIGLEREYSAKINQEESFAGIRTFVFLVLLGFIGALLNYLFSPWIFAGILFAVILFIGISYWSTSMRGDIGGTTEFSALIAFFLGSLTLIGYIEISLIMTVFVVVFLSAKVHLHTIVGKITRTEMYDFLRFVVAALLIFPFLPDIHTGPFLAINPHEIGWVILLTSGLGFLGYVLMKFLGTGKGILLTGIVGGMVSSTLVTWIFARKSNENQLLSSICATAILAASSLMILRVFIWIIIFNVNLIYNLLFPMFLVLITGVSTAFYFNSKSSGENKYYDHTVQPGNPLNMQGAIVFGVIYSLVILMINYTNSMFGETGIYLSSAVAGLTDIDAISISVSKLSLSGISILTAQNAILIAVFCNTLIKLLIVMWFGSAQLRLHVLIGYGCISFALLVAFYILNTTG